MANRSPNNFLKIALPNVDALSSTIVLNNFSSTDRFSATKLNFI
jgi:hypothetical protein